MIDPTTLDEAVDSIVAQMTPAQQEHWRTHSARECIGPIHHTGGMGMRNRWGLWDDDSPLSRNLSAHGAYHADDRSSLIFNALWHRLNGLPHDIAAEVEANRLHWAAQGVKPDGTPL